VKLTTSVVAAALVGASVLGVIPSAHADPYVATTPESQHLLRDLHKFGLTKPEDGDDDRFLVQQLSFDMCRQRLRGKTWVRMWKTIAQDNPFGWNDGQAELFTLLVQEDVCDPLIGPTDD
jgi:hypothetical protein